MSKDSLGKFILHPSGFILLIKFVLHPSAFILIITP